MKETRMSTHATRPANPPSLMHYRPGHMRRGEHEELLAAILAAPLIAADERRLAPYVAVHHFRAVLAILREENPHG